MEDRGRARKREVGPNESVSEKTERRERRQEKRENFHKRGAKGWNVRIVTDAERLGRHSTEGIGMKLTSFRPKPKKHIKQGLRVCELRCGAIVVDGVHDTVSRAKDSAANGELDKDPARAAGQTAMHARSFKLGVDHRCLQLAKEQSGRLAERGVGPELAKGRIRFHLDTVEDSTCQ